MNRRSVVAAVATALVATACSGSGSAPTTRSTASTPVVTPTGDPAAVERTVAAAGARRLPVLSGPDYLAVTTQAVWVKTDSGLLVAIDPDGRRISRRIHVAGALCQGLGNDGESLWTCTDDGVEKVDARTGRVTARLQVHKSEDQGPIPVAFGRVWLVVAAGSADATDLVGVDTATNRIVTRVPLGSRCSDVAAGHDALFVACHVAGELLRVDPERGTVTGRLPGLDDPRRVSAAGDVWVGERVDLVRVDPRTMRVTGRTRNGPGPFGAVLAETDAVWVRAPGRLLQRLDPQTLEVVDSITAPEQTGGSVAVGHGAVWATLSNDDVLYRIPLDD